jgi:hypothetical protein
LTLKALRDKILFMQTEYKGDEIAIVFYREHQIRLRSWVARYDGCLLTNITIDETGYPFAHRSREGALAKAKEIVDRLEAR